VSGVPTTRADILAFMKSHSIAVQASVTPGNAPQAAAVGVIVSDAFEVFFDTLDSSRKVAFVIGGPGHGEERTVQFEGVVDEPSGPELEALKAQYLARFPDGRDRQAWPGLTYLRAKPLWLRFSDFHQTPPEIVELPFDNIP
jgi:hypothetical protein